MYSFQYQLFALDKQNTTTTKTINCHLGNAIAITFVTRTRIHLSKSNKTSYTHQHTKDTGSYAIARDLYNIIRIQKVTHKHFGLITFFVLFKRLTFSFDSHIILFVFSFSLSLSQSYGFLFLFGIIVSISFHPIAIHSAYASVWHWYSKMEVFRCSFLSFTLLFYLPSTRFQQYFRYVLCCR